METLLQDLRYAVRTLRGAPLVTFVAALTVAIGVGATTSMFSVANALLLRPPEGIRDPAELVTVHAKGQDGSSFHSFSYPDFQELDRAKGGLSSLSAYSILAASMRTGDEPRLEVGMLVTGDYFRTLGTRTALGRFFSTEESRDGGPHVVVLSHGLWQRRFQGDPSVIGRSVLINGQPLTIIGIAEPGFHGHFAGMDIALWAPMVLDPILSNRDLLRGRNASWLELIGRRGSGVTAAQAAAALSPVAAASGRLGGLTWDRGVEVRRYIPVPADVALPIGGFLGLLVILAGFVLLIASANVGNVLLARASTRSREIAVRLALGAGRGRVIRQLLTESVLLFTLGGAGGSAVALLVTRALSRFQPPTPIPLVLDFHPDLLVLGVALVVTLIAGIGFGLAPALQTTGADPALVLREGSSTLRFAKSRLRGGLVAAQVAGSACLLVTAGLFTRALGRAGQINPGFDPSNIQVLSLDLSVRGYEGARMVAFTEALERRVAAIPGVASVGSTDLLPLNMSNQRTEIALPDRAAEPNAGRFEVDFTGVTPGYLKTLGIPVLKGRDFLLSDRQGGPGVAIVNQTMARRLWPGEDPIGKRVSYGSFTKGDPTEIIGIAADANYRALGEEPLPMIYVPLAQQPRRAVTLLVRTTPNAPAPIRALHQALHDVDPELPVQQEGSFTSLIGVALLPNRIALLLATLFGATGLLLASVGLYGLLAYRVQSRRKEIGIRIALGATARDIRRLVVREGIVVTATGLSIGLVLAAGVTRLLGNLLFGVSPLDPGTYGGIAGILLLVGWIAAAAPTRRALRTEPIEVLRHG